MQLIVYILNKEGQYVYIPREQGIRSKWGTRSGVKKELEQKIIVYPFQV